jgi:hypothetical protein
VGVGAGRAVGGEDGEAVAYEGAFPSHFERKVEKDGLCVGRAGGAVKGMGGGRKKVGGQVGVLRWPGLAISNGRVLLTRSSLQHSNRSLSLSQSLKSRSLSL